MTVPSNFFICGRNMADYSALSATSELSTLAATNLQVSRRARTWRSTSAAVQTIRLTWADYVSERLNFVMLNRHNLENAAVWRIKCYASYDWTGTPLYDSGDIEAYETTTLGDLDFGVVPLPGGGLDPFIGQRYSVHYFLENESVINSVEIIIDDTGNGYGYIEASRLFVGRGLELSHNPNTLSVKWNENTSQERMDGGSLMSDGTAQFRDMVADLGIINGYEQAGSIFDIYRFAGKRFDVFAAARPGVGGEEERDSTGIWRISQLESMEVVVNPLWKSRLQLTEA